MHRQIKSTPPLSHTPQFTTHSQSPPHKPLTHPLPAFHTDTKTVVLQQPPRTTIMLWLLFKYCTTAAVVVLVSEVAKRSDRLGALFAALPIVTTLVLIWMYVEGQGNDKLSMHSVYTFWFVLPTLPMFLIFPHLLERFHFWLALAISCTVSVICFIAVHYIAQRFGVKLL